MLFIELMVSWSSCLANAYDWKGVSVVAEQYTCLEVAPTANHHMDMLLQTYECFWISSLLQDTSKATISLYLPDFSTHCHHNIILHHYKPVEASLQGVCDCVNLGSFAWISWLNMGSSSMIVCIWSLLCALLIPCSLLFAPFFLKHFTNSVFLSVFHNFQ